MELSERLAEALMSIYAYLNPYLSLWPILLLVGGFILLFGVSLSSYIETRNKRLLWATMSFFVMTIFLLLLEMFAKR